MGIQGRRDSSPAAGLQTGLRTQVESRDRVPARVWRPAVLLGLLASCAFSAPSLIDAIKSGQRASAVEMTEKKSADVNAQEADGSTALIWAANLNDADLVTRLLKAGANPKVKNKLGSTPLSEACFNANTPMIKALLDAGADPNVTGADGQTPLMLVARTADTDAAKLLLAKGADPNTIEAQRGQTALMWAAASNQGGMVRALLAGGAKPDTKTTVDMMTPLVSGEPRAQPRPPGGITAMIFASREGCVDCVKALLEKGAEVDLADPDGVTPLITAVWNTRFDTAKVLIEAGANVNKWDWWGRTALYLAVDYNTLPHGGRPDQPSLDATTPIQIVELLLNKGANPNLQLKMFPPYRATGNDRGLDGMLGIGTTPLIRAAKAQDNDSIKLLLAHGASVEIPNSLNITPAMAAAGIGSTDRDARGNYRVADIQDRALASLEMLLKAGAELNATGGRTQQSLLHSAAYWGWDRVTTYLLDKGAEINQPDGRGYTALDYAENRAGSPGNTIDVSAGRELTDAVLKTKGAKAGTPIPQAGPGGRGGAAAGRGGRGGAPQGRQ